MSVSLIILAPLQTVMGGALGAALTKEGAETKLVQAQIFRGRGAVAGDRLRGQRGQKEL